MSISSRITSMEQHIGNAYDKLDELGVDLTNVDKNLNNIAELLNGVYEDYPKTTTTNVIEPSIDNTKAGRMEIDLKGNTEQFTTTGKNLLPQNKYITTQTINGITYTNNGDGTFSLSGTATASTTLLIIPTGQISLEANQPYYFSSSTAYDNQTFNISIVGDEGGATKFLQAGATYTYLQTPTQLRLVFYIDNGKTVSSNAKNVKLQVEQGSSATSYEPYTGATASPNPDYPQDVRVVSGENIVKVVNKNLFDDTVERKNAYPNERKGQVITYTNSNATYTYVKCCKVKADETYKISWKQSTTPASTNNRMGTIVDDNNIALEDNFNTWINSSTNISITPQHTGYLVLGIDKNATDIQIEENSMATSYEEHKEQDFPISLSSRNLFDKSTILENKRTDGQGNIINNTGFFLSDYIPVKPNTSYTFTRKDTTSLPSSKWCDYNSYTSDKTFIQRVYVGNDATTVTITVPNNCYFITFYDALDFVDYIQLEEGSTATEYQPYYNYELCKIGDYKDYPWKDESTGKWYIKKLTGKGNADNLSAIASVTSTIGADLYAYACNISSNINSIATLGSVISNIFTPRILGSTSETTNPNNVRFNMGISKHTSTAQIVISILKTYLNDGQTQTFKTFLQNNNFMFMYILATPIDIEITNATLINQLEAIYNTAKSYDNTTNIIQENNDLPFILDIKTLKKS